MGNEWNEMKLANKIPVLPHLSTETNLPNLLLALRMIRNNGPHWVNFAPVGHFISSLASTSKPWMWNSLPVSWFDCRKLFVTRIWWCYFNKYTMCLNICSEFLRLLSPKTNSCFSILTTVTCITNVMPDDEILAFYLWKKIAIPLQHATESLCLM